MVEYPFNDLLKKIELGVGLGVVIELGNLG